MASVRSCQKLPPRPVEPMTADSKMDLTLANTKLIHSCGSASVITYLSMGKTTSKTA